MKILIEQSEEAIAKVMRLHSRTREQVIDDIFWVARESLRDIFQDGKQFRIISIDPLVTEEVGEKK